MRENDFSTSDASRRSALYERFAFGIICAAKILSSIRRIRLIYVFEFSDVDVNFDETLM